jgi:hypothetical protein
MLARVNCDEVDTNAGQAGRWLRPCANQQRNPAATREFQRQNPCPSTGKTNGRCLGCVKDHVVPPCAGGANALSNMPW